MITDKPELGVVVHWNKMLYDLFWNYFHSVMAGKFHKYVRSISK